MKQYPTTIDNGHGEQITFLGIGSRNGIECMRVKNKVGPNSGPPMHIHHHQHEELTIDEGLMGTQIAGKEPRFFQAGETALFEAGVAHKFWNAGETTLKCTGSVWPVYNFEYFLTEIFRSVKASKNNRPSITDSAFLLEHYKTEFDMLEIPFFVRKMILPSVYKIGKASGLFRKFTDAPDPFKG